MGIGDVDAFDMSDAETFYRLEALLIGITGDDQACDYRGANGVKNSRRVVEWGEDIQAIKRRGGR